MDTRIIVAVAVVIAGWAVYDTYRIGDSGSKAVWTGEFGSAPTNGGPDGD